MARTSYQIEGGAGVSRTAPTTNYRPKSRGDTVGTGVQGYTKPTSAPLPPTRTATQDWTVQAQRPPSGGNWVNGINLDTHYANGTPRNQGVTTTPPPSTTTTTGPTTVPPVIETTNVGEETGGPGGAGGGATDGAAGMLEQFTSAEIESALAGLEAQYGMTREQLLADQSMIGAQYRLLMARLNRSRQMGIESATNDAVSRGIYNSGILGENIQQVETDYMEQTRAQEEQRLAQEQAIQSQLDFLDPQLRAEQGSAEAALRREQANYYMQAGISPPAGAGGGGLGGGAGAGFGGAPAPGGGGAVGLEGVGAGAEVGGFVNPQAGVPGQPGAAGDGMNAYANSQFNQLLAQMGAPGAQGYAPQVAGLGHQGTGIPFTALTTAAGSGQQLNQLQQLYGSGREVNATANAHAQAQLGNTQGGTIASVDDFLNRLTPEQLAALGQQGIANLQGAQGMTPEGLVNVLGRVNSQLARGG